MCETVQESGEWTKKIEKAFVWTREEYLCSLISLQFKAGFQSVPQIFPLAQQLCAGCARVTHFFPHLRHIFRLHQPDLCHVVFASIRRSPHPIGHWTSLKLHLVSRCALGTIAKTAPGHLGVATGKWVCQRKVIVVERLQASSSGEISGLGNSRYARMWSSLQHFAGTPPPCLLLLLLYIMIHSRKTTCLMLWEFLCNGLHNFWLNREQRDRTAKKALWQALTVSYKNGTSVHGAVSQLEEEKPALKSNPFGV